MESGDSAASKFGFSSIQPSTAGFRILIFVIFNKGMDTKASAAVDERGWSVALQMALAVVGTGRAASALAAGGCRARRRGEFGTEDKASREGTEEGFGVALRGSFDRRRMGRRAAFRYQTCWPFDQQIPRSL